MSRIGKSPIKIPSGVSVTIENDTVKVDGPKGSLTQLQVADVKVVKEGDTIVVKRTSDDKIPRSNHGLMRTLLDNMVVGVSQGFEKKLEVNGVGFRVSVSGDKLAMNLGYSHPINYQIPKDINIDVKQNIITISGASKQQVGQVSAEIRSLRKPEPYKGKGIKYVDERIIRKSGKSGKE